MKDLSVLSIQNTQCAINGDLRVQPGHLCRSLHPYSLTSLSASDACQCCWHSTVIAPCDTKPSPHHLPSIKRGRTPQPYFSAFAITAASAPRDWLTSVRDAFEK